MSAGVWQLSAPMSPPPKKKKPRISSLTSSSCGSSGAAASRNDAPRSSKMSKRSRGGGVVVVVVVMGGGSLRLPSQRRHSTHAGSFRRPPFSSSFIHSAIANSVRKLQHLNRPPDARARGRTGTFLQSVLRASAGLLRGFCSGWGASAQAGGSVAILLCVVRQRRFRAAACVCVSGLRRSDTH